MLTGKTRLYGVFGYPVEHSLSPAMQNFFSEKMGKDQVYVPLLVDAERLDVAYAGAWEMNFQGINATIPHKMKLVNLVSEIDEMAAKIGAVNTLVRKGQGFKGYNTDYSGLKKVFRWENMLPAGRHALLIGAGGAAQAVAYSLASEQIASLTIMNRTLEKAEVLAEKIRKDYPELPIVVCQDTKGLTEEKYFAVQTTSVGMHHQDGQSPIREDGFYSRIDMAIDLIYSPAVTCFMEQVTAHGGKAVNGLSLLLFQGIDAYELWNRLSLPETVIREAWDYMQELAYGPKEAVFQKKIMESLAF